MLARFSAPGQVLRATDLEHVPDEAIRIYDDGTERGARTLYFGDRQVRE